MQAPDAQGESENDDAPELTAAANVENLFVYCLEWQDGHSIRSVFSADLWRISYWFEQSLHRYSKTGMGFLYMFDNSCWCDTAGVMDFFVGISTLAPTKAAESVDFHQWLVGGRPPAAHPVKYQYAQPRVDPKAMG